MHDKNTKKMMNLQLLPKSASLTAYGNLSQKRLLRKAQPSAIKLSV